MTSWAPTIGGRPAPPIDLLPPPARWPRTRSWYAPISVVLGLWTFVSIFMWPHGRAELIDTALVGTLICGVGAVSWYVRWVRWLNVLLGAWLCASTLAMSPVAPPTIWNALAVGSIVAVINALGR
jgi:hypothetical protein